MMDRDEKSQIGKATRDQQAPEIERDADADALAMSQEDDPAGDGHM